MKKRALKITLIVLALLAGAAFATGHGDDPCTGDDHDCAGESQCEDCTCDSLSKTEATSAPIDEIEDIEEEGCRGCPGGGCR